MAGERGQWTIKSKRLDAELQTACRMAAERQGMAVGDWCVETLRVAARAALTGEGPPSSPPPARLEDVRDLLLGEVERRMVELVERLAPQPGVPQAGPVPHAAPQAVEAAPQAAPQATDREARRLRTLLRRARR